MTTTALERLLDVVAGGGAVAPVHVAFGTVLDAVAPGRAVARVPTLPPHRLRGPGVVPVLGDLVLSAAITSTLPAGWGISTLTLHIAVLGPLPAPGAPLVATAELLSGPAGADGSVPSNGSVGPVHAGGSAGSVDRGDAGRPPGSGGRSEPGRTAVSRAEVCAVDGRPVAHLTARCAVVPSPGERPPLHGDPDPDPFAALGAATAPVAAPMLANAGGGVQGGVLAAVLGDAIGSATPGGRGQRRLARSARIRRTSGMADSDVPPAATSPTPTSTEIRPWRAQ